MYIQKSLITDADGNYVFSVKADGTETASIVTAERETTKGWTEERTMKKMVSVPPYVYYEWADKLGAECWNDKEFLKFFRAHSPHYCI
jgi:hypothetical protein